MTGQYLSLIHIYTTERVTILEPDGETQEITEENAYYRQLVHPEQDSLTGLGVRFFVEADNTLTDERCV